MQGQTVRETDMGYDLSLSFNDGVGGSLLEKFSIGWAGVTNITYVHTFPTLHELFHVGRPLIPGLFLPFERLGVLDIPEVFMEGLLEMFHVLFYPGNTPFGHELHFSGVGVRHRDG